MPQDRDQNVWQLFARYSSVAFVLPISTLIGYAMGWGLDKLFHTHFLYLIFLGLGTVAGFIEVVRELSPDKKDDGR